MTPTREQRIKGCFFGGAVGDALGWPVEFSSIEDIRATLGPDGVTDLPGEMSQVTDDTQMTIFTAEGLIRAATGGVADPVGIVDHAYARWLLTQGVRSTRWNPDAFDGWLITEAPELHARRAPGRTCLEALSGPVAGTVEDPINDSKGCGGVMRVAPVGLLDPRFPGDRFELGAELAALTHGHPSGSLSAGALALIIDAIVWRDVSLERAVDEALGRLDNAPGGAETAAALRHAVQLAESEQRLTPERIAGELGGAWVGEEALAISVYCALKAETFVDGVRLAVNHSGDSDSTGAITGNILGALLGFDAIPTGWVQGGFDLCVVMTGLTIDWLRMFDEDLSERYPGW